MTTTQPQKLPFGSDYLQGAHPALLDQLVATNMQATPGYGTDAYSDRARELIRVACEAPQAEVHFLIGGTQANAVAIDALLSPWQGVIAARTGHISLHEAGAIEASGHKVLELPSKQGKLSPADVKAFVDGWWQDDNHDHMVMPGLIYISQPTEYGTLYSLSELQALRAVCDEHDMRLYVDGARLAYALAAPTNDVTLADLARLADAFYIGGTKCGALFGEAMVFPVPNTCPHFFTVMKRRGALLAKGRLLGIQFQALFENGLYQRIGEDAVEQAERIARMFIDAGYELAIPQYTNQVFVSFDDATLARLEDEVDMSFWEHLPNGRTVMRLATSWASTEDDVAALAKLLA